MIWFQFRFADKIDVILMVVAALCSMAHGTAMPLLLVVFGDLTQKFVANSGSGYVNWVFSCYIFSSSDTYSYVLEAYYRRFNVIVSETLAAYPQVITK